MKAIEFCYWLQGLFEINNPRELGVIQVELIEKHLKMVYLHEKEQSKYLDFCKGLTGYMKISGRGDFDSFVTGNLRKQLDNLFEHVIKSPVEEFPFYHRKGMSLDSPEKSELILC